MASPIYIQIHNRLRKAVEDGQWQVGDKIPSERELAIQFGVSRMTLRQAVQTLVEEGLLERRVGAGTYVANRKVQERMSGVTSFTELMEQAGKVPSSRTVSYHITAPSLSESEKLQLAPTEQILRMERIRFGNDEPICFEVATVPERLIKRFSKEDVTNSLYRVLEDEAGLKVGHAQQTVSAMTASERVAEYLNVKRSAPLLRLRQVSFLNDGTPFEYVRTQYVGSRFEFYLER
ncbi:GntR family transcriptional regulator [Furfurilactobacillus curtus]|uniref:GntR family transcriptional regulator n=1 Tax=Furfurilactobacillus curtus TaxID=1746200 RepID=A0ABQ5JP14_9LACO